jgi:pantetheine-phosphate adenylyltransferase
VDIIKRGLNVFDHLIVAVLENPKKTALFTTKERVNMISEILSEQKNMDPKWARPSVCNDYSWCIDKTASSIVDSPQNSGCYGFSRPLNQC